jgi:hypothetical protein
MIYKRKCEYIKTKKFNIFLYKKTIIDSIFKLLKKTYILFPKKKKTITKYTI